MTKKEYAEIVVAAEKRLAQNKAHTRKTLTEVHNGRTELLHQDAVRTVWIRFIPRTRSEQAILDDTPVVTHLIKFKSSRAFPLMVKNFKGFHKQIILRQWNLYVLDQMEKVPCYASADLVQSFEELADTYFMQIFW